MKKKDKLDENGEPIDDLEDADLASEEGVGIEKEEVDFDAMDSSDSMEGSV